MSEPTRREPSYAEVRSHMSLVKDPCILLPAASQYSVRDRFLGSTGPRNTIDNLLLYFIRWGRGLVL